MPQEIYQELQRKFQHYKHSIFYQKLQLKVFIQDKKFFLQILLYLDLVKKYK